MRRAYYTYHMHVVDNHVRVDKLNTQRESVEQAKGVFRLQEKEEITPLLESIRDNQLNSSDDARKIGEFLFDALFDDVLCHDFFRFHHQVTRIEDQFLRLELDIEEDMPEVAALPWEFMCLPERKNLASMWICTEPKLVFSRRRSLWIPIRKIQLDRNEKLRIALVVSAPTGLGKVVYEPVQDALRKLVEVNTSRIELLPMEEAASSEAIDRLVSRKPHIFHFIGHGRLKDEGDRKVGEIALVDDIDEAMWVDASFFSSLFNENPPNVLMLQACEGGMESASKAFVGVASRCHQQNIPVVVAMQYEISNITATKFALRFYRKLSEGEPVDIAAQEGRKGIALGPTQYRKRDFATPIIFMRVKDGYLFEETLKSVPSPDPPTSNSIPNLPTSNLVPDPPRSSSNNLPSTGAVKFVGREEELSILHQQLQENVQGTISAITGMGGVGKTELALQYAMRYQSNYSGGICWLQVKGIDIGTQIVQFGRLYLKLDPPEDLDVPAQVKFCWLHWPPGEALVVLDDVINYEQVKPYLPLPTETRFKILITTRFQLGRTVKTLPIDVLAEDAALALLEAQIGSERIQRERESAKQLCAWLEFLPLGLELVGRYLYREPDLSLTSMQQRLKDKGLDERAIRRADADMTSPLGVAAAFEVSWEKLEEPVKRLGCLLSLFGLAPIPWSLVQEIDNTRDPSNLVAVSLLQRVGEGSYRLHQLIREFLREKLKHSGWADELEESYCRAMVSQSKQIPQPLTQTSIEDIAVTIPHISEAANTLSDHLRDEDLIIPFTYLGYFYQNQGLYTQAEPWYVKCLALVQTRLGKFHGDLATSLNNLAELYRAQGRYSEAEPLYQEALKLRKDLLGENNPDVATSLNNLAELHRERGRYTEAELLYSEALQFREQLLGENHPAVADSLSGLAALYLGRGQYDEAESYYDRVLKLRQNLLGSDHPDVATSLNHLSNLYSAQGRYGEAESLCRQALEIRQHLLGYQHPDVADNLNSLAAIYYSQGRYSEAEAQFTQALKLRQEVLGSSHPDVANSLNNLGYLYCSQSRYDEAEPLLDQALQLRRSSLGDCHPELAISFDSLATLYIAKNRYGDSESLYRQALQIRQQLFGYSHPDIAASLDKLAVLYHTQKNYSLAEPLFFHALSLRQSLLGENHPDTLTSLNNLAVLYFYQERFSEAEPLLIKALEIRNLLLGANHPDTIYTRKSLEKLQSRTVPVK